MKTHVHLFTHGYGWMAFRRYALGNTKEEEGGSEVSYKQCRPSLQAAGAKQHLFKVVIEHKAQSNGNLFC